MEHEMMDLEQLAVYLDRDLREVTKLANRGHLPGQKVGGQWRFAPAEINYWIETQLHAYSEEELAVLESTPATGGKDEQPPLTTLLSESTMAVPLAASTRTSLLKELMNLAEQSWQIYDPEALLNAVRQREEIGSTGMAGGLAIPHPHRPLPAALGESIVAFGRTPSGIPFGAPDGGLTDLFFLVCCRDQRTHLQTLARISRLFLRPGFADELRGAQTVSEAWYAIDRAERELQDS